MLIIAHHNIHDVDGFWTGAKEVVNTLPDQFKIHGIYPARDGKTGTCLWEAENVQDVQQFLDKVAGMYSENFCYEVNVEQSIGLPEIQMAEAVH